MLDAVPPGGDDRHLLQDEDRALPVSGQEGGGSGRVRHPEPGAPPQLHQPGAVRFCGGEVQKEAAAAHEEDQGRREGVAVEKQPLVPLIRGHNVYVSKRTRGHGRLNVRDLTVHLPYFGKRLKIRSLLLFRFIF